MIRQTWRDGWRRVRSAPALAASVFAMTLLLALPLALTMRGMLQAHFGASLDASQAADGVNYNAWQEFLAQTTGLGTTFTPSILGFATVLDNVSSVLDGETQVAPVTTALAFYLVGWTLLSGGIIDRYARQRPTGLHGFSAAAGVYFLRFLRLALLAGLAYWWLFAYVHPWLFDTLYARWTRGMNVERTAFLVRLGLYLLLGALLVLVNVIVDYAKIRLVVEDRRSVIGAGTGAIRFLQTHPRDVFGLYALNALVFFVLLAFWLLVAPGAGGAGLSMWLGLFVSQVYIIARLGLKLQFIASQTALYQAHLAHARYTAAPVPAWPESPTAELISTS